MQIIPVLDVLGGLVVRGYKGERNQYRPITSAIIESPDPFHVARVVLQITGSKDIYVADLDALQNKGDNLDILKDLQSRTTATLWIDAGTGKAGQVDALLRKVPGCKAVIGSETLETAEDFYRISSDCPAEKMIFSLDIKMGIPWTPENSPFRNKSVEEGVHLLAENGWKEVILLTLDGVGTGKGLPTELFRKSAEIAPEISLFAGGGLRSREELAGLKAVGITGVLVASALHERWLTEKDILELET
jgi:phosphoribosylformimino-5-aminoimidazole carboxamide ribotide isomerase